MEKRWARSLWRGRRQGRGFDGYLGRDWDGKVWRLELA